MAVSGPQWCKEGLREMADAVCKDAATPEILKIGLFSNDFTIADGTVFTDLTIIASNGGEATNLTKASFAVATDADPVVSRWNDATGKVWTITGDLTIYGWAIYGATSSHLYCAENWGVSTVHNGNTVTIQPLDIKFDIPEA
jgi:hypothetical protein